MLMYAVEGGQKHSNYIIKGIRKKTTFFWLLLPHRVMKWMRKWVTEWQVALLPLHSPPHHYYSQAAPPLTTVYVFESVNLGSDNALCLEGEKKMNFFFFFFFFPHPQANDTRGVWEIVMENKLCRKCFSVKKNYFLLSAGDFFVSFPPFSLPLSFWHVLWYSGNSFNGLLQLEMAKQKLEAYFSYWNNWAEAVKWEECCWCAKGWRLEYCMAFRTF